MTVTFFFFGDETVAQLPQWGINTEQPWWANIFLHFLFQTFGIFFLTNRLGFQSAIKFRERKKFKCLVKARRNSQNNKFKNWCVKYDFLSHTEDYNVFSIFLFHSKEIVSRKTNFQVTVELSLDEGLGSWSWWRERVIFLDLKSSDNEEIFFFQF